MSHRNALFVMVLAGTVLWLASCAQPQPTPEPATAVAEAAEAVQAVQSEFALDGTAWQLESIGEPESSIPVVAESYPSLGFMAERYSGYTGCDYFLGVYEVEEDSLRMQTPASTQWGCDQEALVNQGATYQDALLNITEYAIEDGKLVMYTVEKQRMLTMIPLEAVTFEGTTWDLAFYSPEIAYWVPNIPGTVISAQFDGEQLSGNAGCNDYTAETTRNGDQLVIGEPTVADLTCAEPEGVMDQESSYLSMLQTVGKIQQFPRSLELLAADGTPLLMYHAR